LPSTAGGAMPDSGAAESIRFVPSRVVGLPAVTEVAVWPDRLQLLSAGRWLSYRFADMQKPLWPAPFWATVSRLGWRRPRFIAEGHWFGDPRQRHIAFYLEPRLCVYMPSHDWQADYSKSIFARIQTLIRLGGFVILNADSQQQAS